MNLSLIQRLKSYLSNLTLSSSIILSLILCFFLKQPMSLLFKLLGINSYFYLFCGLFSGLLTYTKAVGNMEVPSKKPLYLSIAIGAFVSLFFYYLPYSILIEVYMYIGLGVLSLFDRLPAISLLHGLKSGKFYVNKDSFSGFKDALKNFFYGNKIPQGGSLNRPLQDLPSKKTTLLSERASGKRPQMGDYGNDPQEGSSKRAKTDESQPSSENYTIKALEIKDVCLKVISKKLAENNPSELSLASSYIYKTVYMSDIDSYTGSDTHSSLLKKWAAQYPIQDTSHNLGSFIKCIKSYRLENKATDVAVFSTSSLKTSIGEEVFKAMGASDETSIIPNNQLANILEGAKRNSDAKNPSVTSLLKGPQFDSARQSIKNFIKDNPDSVPKKVIDDKGNVNLSQVYCTIKLLEQIKNSK